MLIEEAKIENINTPSHLYDMNPYDKAMWFFINDKNLFFKVFNEYEIESSIGWTFYQTRPFVSEKDIIKKERIEELENKISDYFFKSEIRGKKCKVEVTEKSDYVCFVAYPEDYAQKHLSYDDSTKLNKDNTIQSVFKIYFLCYPETQRVGIKTKGGWQRKDDLIKIFGESILKQILTNKDKIAYRLNKLKDFNFSFGTPPEDGVETVKVTSLRFSYPNTEKVKQFIVNVGTEGQGLEDIGEWIREHDMNIDHTKITITQAKIRVKFKKSPEMFKKAKGTVTATITAPNSCNLGIKPLHNKVKEYLVNWGIDTRNEK